MASLSMTKSVFASRHAAPRLSADVADAFQTLKDLFNPYRPELHYMRGPGPKWRAKNRRQAGASRPATDLVQA